MPLSPRPHTSPRSPSARPADRAYLETRAAWSAHDAAGDVVTVTRVAGRTDPTPPHVRARTQHPEGKAAAGHRGRRRRLRAQYPIYPKSTLIAWATRKLGRSLRWTSERAELSLSNSHARNLVAMPSWRWIRTENSSASGSRPKPTSAPMSRWSPPPFRQPAWPRSLRPLPNSGNSRRFRLRLHQYRNGRCHPRRRQARGTVPARTPGRHRRPRNRPRPVASRRLNLLEASEMPYASASGYTYDAADCVRLFERRSSRPTSQASRPAAESEAAGRRRGLGVSCHLHGTGGIADEHRW